MRQAVIVIHGIGEQRPMDTVRGFVEAVMPDPPGSKPRFWSKPDPMSELFELRKLTTPQTRSIPPTDFYEYYWAFQAQGTKFTHVLAWARTLLLRRPANVPRHLTPLWWTLWLLIVATAVFVSTPYWGQLFSLGTRAVAASRVLSAISSGALLVISGFILNYIGDAARYLNPSPANIDMRRRIRAEGVDLLRRLHESGQYDRIVVVGHSLGSVIAYDILKNLWPHYNTVHAKLAQVDQAAIHNLDAITARLTERPREEDLVREFRDNQVELWKEERRLGSPWLVTDLITLGSPLAHAELLLARTKKELSERQNERELPTCPPILDEKSASFRLTNDLPDGNKRTIFVLHHAALFGSTRWTNVYFPATGGFFGDLVGGPLREVFGRGIRDVAVKSAEWRGWLQHTPIIHTHYWNLRTAPETKSKTKQAWAIDVLRQSLDLESRVLLREVERESQDVHTVRPQPS